MPISYAKQLYSNNAFTTLSSDLEPGDSVITLTEGSNFPNPSGGSYFLVTLDDGLNIEVVAAYGRSGYSLTGCVRGQEGTTARSFKKGAKIECRLTAGSVSSFLRSSDVLTPVGTLADLGLTTSSNNTSYVVAEADSGGSPTLAMVSGNKWSFPSYPNTVHTGTCDATSTPTSVAYTGNTALQGLYSSKGLIIQFTSGAQRGACRFVSSIASGRINWATALPASPALSDTFEVYHGSAARITFLNTTKANIDNPIFTGNVGIGVGSTASYPLHVEKNQNAQSRIHLSNTTAGTASMAQLVLASDAATLGIEVISSGFTTSGVRQANHVLIQSGGSADALHINATKSTAPIIFSTGGSAASNDRGRFDSAGSFIVGQSTKTSSERVLISYSSAGAVPRTLQLHNPNTTTGTGSLVAFSGLTNSGAQSDLVQLIGLAENATGNGALAIRVSASGTANEVMRLTSAGVALIGRSAQSSGGKLEVAGNIVANLPSVAPTLGTNSDMSFQLVSDTQLKILVRGSDGVTRSATLTLA